MQRCLAYILAVHIRSVYLCRGVLPELQMELHADQALGTPSLQQCLCPDLKNCASRLWVVFASESASRPCFQRLQFVHRAQTVLPQARLSVRYIPN